MKHLITLILFVAASVGLYSQVSYERVELHTYSKRMTALQRDTVWLPNDYDLTGDSVSFSVGILGDSVQTTARIAVTDCNGNTANTTWATYEITPWTSTINRRAVFGSCFKRHYSWWCGRIRLVVYNGRNSVQQVQLKIYRHKRRGG